MKHREIDRFRPIPGMQVPAFPERLTVALELKLHPAITGTDFVINPDSGLKLLGGSVKINRQQARSVVAEAPRRFRQIRRRPADEGFPLYPAALCLLSEPAR